MAMISTDWARWRKKLKAWVGARNRNAWFNSHENSFGVNLLEAWKSSEEHNTGKKLEGMGFDCMKWFGLPQHGVQI
jgi:hypothetical protein